MSASVDRGIGQLSFAASNGRLENIWSNEIHPEF